MPYEIQYLIEKLESIFTKALEEEEENKKRAYYSNTKINI
jgi:hypothetical protein